MFNSYRQQKNEIMKELFIIVLVSAGSYGYGQEIYHFSQEEDWGDWYIVDDRVMGGRSQGGMAQSDQGHALFKGQVSLENNGGFSSIRYRPETISTGEHSYFKIRLKGDQRNYQFRVRSSLGEYQSYVFEFSTSGNWEVVSIPFDAMYPSWRGRKLDMPNYPGKLASEFSFLIANNRNEDFRLEIERVWME